MTARGGHQWWWVVEEGFLRVFSQSFERERHEIMFFTLKNIFIISRSHLASSSMFFRAEERGKHH